MRGANNDDNRKSHNNAGKANDHPTAAHANHKHVFLPRVAALPPETYIYVDDKERTWSAGPHKAGRPAMTGAQCPVGLNHL